ncbi:MAG: permease [Chloroflexota bacterium]
MIKQNTELGPGAGPDMKAMRRRQMKGLIRGWTLVGILALATVLLLRIFPDKREASVTTMQNFFKEMLLILPAVMVMIGLITVWVPRETVLKYMGKASGIKGIFLSIAFGSLPAGPLYLAFPLASTLLEKGASISNVIIFLSAWACIKIPQELMEIQFLGVNFTLLRLALTAVTVVAMGKLIERLMEH